MRVIVTGGCGFIGSSFVHLLHTWDIDMLVVDKLTYAGNENNIPSGVPLLEMDICDVTAEDLGEFTHLVNFAAETHVDNSIENGRPFVRTNVEGTFNLLEIARKNPNLKKFIQISTDEVYGDLEDDDIKSSVEGDNLNPSSYYSATKVSADMLVFAAMRTYENRIINNKYIVVRPCNNFGDRQHPEKFIPKLIDCVKNDKPIPLYGDGRHKREWLWVEDTAAMIFNLMKLDGSGGIYNLGSGLVIPNIEIIQAIPMLLDKEITIKFVKDRLGHDRRYTLNSERFREESLLRPSKSLFAYLTEKLK